MNTDAIQISPILGTDSLSSSRIVINDNFRILANILENYQAYFNETGVYSSTIISKNEEGTIDFKTDESHEIMKLSSTGIEIYGKLVVNGENSSEFEKIKTDKIYPKSEGTENSPSKLSIIGDVEIQGNLSVSGNVPGGEGSETVLVQSIKEFKANIGSGYSNCYKKGCYISPIINENRPINTISTRELEGLLREDPKTLIQYITKPFIFCGKGVKIAIDDSRYIQRILTNGKLITGPEPGQYIVSPTCNTYEEAEAVTTIIRIYPVVSDMILEGRTKMLNFEFSTLPR